MHILGLFQSHDLTHYTIYINSSFDSFVLFGPINIVELIESGVLGITFMIKLTANLQLIIKCMHVQVKSKRCLHAKSTICVTQIVSYVRSESYYIIHKVH